MSMKSTRNVLSIILIVLIAAAGCVFSVATAVKATVCSQSYMQRVVYSDEVVEQCMADFDNRIDALAQRSGIPSRAFEAVRNFDEIASDSPVSRLFNGHDTTLYNEATVERFEKLCKEYLDGNSIEYDEKMIRSTAEEAARIYSDCFGMKNTQQAKAFIDSFNDSYQSFCSLSLFIIVACVVMLFLLYSKTKDIFSIVFSAFTAQGIACVLIGAVLLISDFSGKLLISPQIYANAVSKAVGGMLLLLMIFGFALAGICIFFNVALHKRDKQ